MYLESRRPEVQEFYAKFGSELELFRNLNNEQLTVCRKYFMQITKYKAESIEGKALIINGYEYVNAVCNLNNNIKCEDIDGQQVSSYIGYIIKDLKTGKESRVASGVVDKLMAGRNLMIKSLADNTLLELRYITYLSITNNVDEYIKTKSRRLALVLDDKTIIDKFMPMYKEFYNVYLPLPTYLLERFNQKADIQYQKNVFERYIQAFTKDVDSITVHGHSLTDLAKSIIVNSHDHMERLKYAELIVNYNKAYLKLSNHGKRDLMVFVKAGMQRVYYVHAKNGDRLATKNEQKLLVSACFKKNVYFIAEEKLNLIKVFTWAHTGKYELLSSAGYDISDYAVNKEPRADSYKIMFNSTIMDVLNDSIKYLTSDEFLQDATELVKGVNPIEYLDTAEDEIKDLGLKVKLETIKKECGRTSNNFLKMAYDISFKALKYDNLVLSVKQMNVINKAYESLVSVKNSDNNKFNAELVEMIHAIMDYNRYKKGTFMYKLIGSVMENKRCSLKQYEIIETEYDKIKTVIDTEVDEIGEDENYYASIKDKQKTGMDDMFVNESTFEDKIWDESGDSGVWNTSDVIIPDIIDTEIFS